MAAELAETVTAFAVLELTLPQIKDVILRLGVPLHVLDNIDYVRSGGERLPYYVQEWLNREEPSWDKLAAALFLAGFKNQAKTLIKLKNADQNSLLMASNLPQSPLTDVLGVLTDLGLSQEQIKNIARSLGVSNATLDNIDTQHHANDRNAHYIKAWLDSFEGEPTMEHIIAALVATGQKRKAEQLNESVAKQRAVASKKQ